jgi:DNA/RNA-binding domain of Phe-tRNA-synthetase-like protein
MRLLVDRKVPKRIGGFSIGLAELRGVSVRPSTEAFSRAEKRVVLELGKKHTVNDLKDYPVIAYYRDALWRLGLDPTKMRPSSEALARRALKGGWLPRINSVVDALNLASLRTLVCMGIYDKEKISGPLILRMAEEGEIFYEIGEEISKMTGKELVVADKEKILHAYPCRDSEESKVTLETENVILLAYGAPGIGDFKIKSAMKVAITYIKQFAGGKLLKSGLTRIA